MSNSPFRDLLSVVRKALVTVFDFGLHGLLDLDLFPLKRRMSRVSKQESMSGREDSSKSKASTTLECCRYGVCG